MTTKFISAVLFLFALAVLLSSNNADDPLFLFISNNLLVNIFRVLIIGAVLSLSLARYIKRPGIRTGLKVCGVLLAVFGTIALLSMPLESALYDYVKPLDSLLMLELGITLNLIAITAPKTARGKKPVYSLPKLARLHG